MGFIRQIHVDLSMSQQKLLLAFLAYSICAFEKNECHGFLDADVEVCSVRSGLARHA